MNDRFAAQLRQHLLETADERPADGQLARVIDGVAATTQRHSLTARLTWEPGRIGPFPSKALRLGLLAVALALAAAGGASLAGGPRPPSSVFEGTWITIDPADGSGMTLVVGPGRTPAVYFEDGYASGLACVDDVVKRFTARGTGRISGNRLVATFPDGGGCGLRTVEVPGTYKYDQQRDTLSDQDGVVWTRALGDGSVTQALGTPAPTTSAEAETPSTTPRPSDPARYARFVSAMNGISIDYPESWEVKSATEPWTGGQLSFDTPGADIIFDPAFGGGLYIAIVSQSYGDATADQWSNDSGEWLCPDGVDGAAGSWGIDGANANSVRCDPTYALVVTDETRGYAIQVVVPSAEPALADTYGKAWLLDLLETVDLRPEDAVDPSFAPPASSSPALTPTPEATAALLTPTPDP